jgi:hypothetical protein
MERQPFVDNMNAKLAWMQRSRARMQAGESDTIEVQDHFLSYVHASQLNWHYFGACCAGIGLPKKEPERLVRKWLENTLSEQELDVWYFLNDLRNEDVHVKPVEPLRTSEPRIVTFGEHLITCGGAVVSHGQWRYSVSLRSQDREVF